MAESKLTEYNVSFPKISADYLLELFRELRQSTTTKSEQVENRKEIIPCLELLSKIIVHLSSGNADNVIDKFVLSVCARVGVQFVGNAIVENEDNQNLLWNHSNLLRTIFFYKDTKLKNYSSMVYLNMMISNVSVRDDVIGDDEFISELIDEAMLGLTEFPQFIVEKFLEFNYYDKIYTDKRKLDHKVYILEMLVSLLKSEKDFILDSISVDRISSDFKCEAEAILNGRKQMVGNSSLITEGENSAALNLSDKGQNDSDIQQRKEGEENKKAKISSTDDPRLAIKLLSALCTLSSNDKYIKFICDNGSLVVDTIYVLRALKMAENLKKESGIVNDECNQPIIGFKADLIRLLGNLCWKHKKNQDLVRENNCIELVLECCKLDETNPFICEWAIMAIRNLCENNQENQDFIASLKRISETEMVAMAERIKLNSDNETCL